MFMTRLQEATMCGPSAEDAEPCYHDHCVPTDVNGCGLPDSQGRARVWMPDSMAGFTGNCEACGKDLRVAMESAKCGCYKKDGCYYTCVSHGEWATKDIDDILAAATLDPTAPRS